MSHQDDEGPSGFNIFSKRARILPRKSAEELKAAEELVNKFKKEEILENACLEKKDKKGRKKKREVKAKKSEPISSVSSIPASQSVDDRDILEYELKNVKLSAYRKRKLKKLKEDQEFDDKYVEELNEKVFSAPTDSFNILAIPEEPVEKVDGVEKEFKIPVVYMGKPGIFKCHENEEFSKVFSEVAAYFGIKITEILLCLNDRNISFNDTPKTLGLTGTDMLDCIRYAIGENSGDEDVNSIKVKLQSNFQTTMDMIVHKMDTMQSVMERYSKKWDLPLENLTFSFDGEKLSGTETPTELEMESGSCIDVLITDYIVC